MATSAKFFAAERTIEGPPMSMFSMISANGDAGPLRGLLKGVEIHHHHVDGLDGVLCDGGHVLGVVADVQDAAVDLGVKRLHAAVEHLGEAGQVADVADRQAGVAQGPGGAAGGDQVHAEGGEGAGEVDQAGLVGDGEQGAADGAKISRTGA